MEMDAPQAMTANLLLILAFFGGLVLGLVHFASLNLAVTRYVDGRTGTALAVHALRMVVLGGALYALARTGTGPLLAGALGIFAGRIVIMGLRR
ncbi:hypothetical protein Y88_0537 [Novosphingobium nitrogenifigens DSM 19370]|uniref:N-ATPase, AtpR subunit n=2 Tax=Novosphingobium nitrogenifigens TaxID=378548 RepID=F1ZAB1_9SPHN|nr:hypothetical protein Y88_0537 [Novosphingobium nitrogenifigens DSM 19370]